jgi:regulator of protease activity HflC (stomatin/prohibitin superfamily)
MNIDWRDPPQLSAPKREALMRARMDRERLARSRVCKGDKKHSVNRERSREERDKAARARLAADKNLREAQAYRERVAAYWRGDSDCHPARP